MKGPILIEACCFCLSSFLEIFVQILFAWSSGYLTCWLAVKFVILNLEHGKFLGYADGLLLDQLALMSLI
jgi:hypothetical protein